MRKKDNIFKQACIMITAFMIASQISFFSSCSREELTTPEDDAMEVKDDDYNLLLNVPEAKTSEVKSRGLATDRENYINKLHILFFATATSNAASHPGTAEDYQFVKLISTTSIIADDNGNIKAKIKYPTSTGVSEKQHWGILVIANPPYNTDEQYRAHFASSANHLKALVDNVRQSLTDGQTGTYTSNFCMSGFTGQASLSTDSKIQNISLYRNVSRVDVATKVEKNRFKLLTAYPFNAKKYGRAIGGLANGKNASTHNPDSDNTLVNLKYNDDTYNDMTDRTPVAPYTQSISEKIYLYEYQLHDESKEDSPCIIIGGMFTDDTGYTSKCYYRINIQNKQNKFGLSRNTRYLINIKDVTGVGWPTPEEAYKEIAQNITYTIQEWIPENMDNFVFDGDRSLAISEAYTELPSFSAGRSISIEVQTTNLPERAWTVEAKNPSVKWCSINAVRTQYNENGGQFTIDINESLPEDQSERSAEFIIKAKVMELKYIVTQKNTIGYLEYKATPEIMVVGKNGFPDVTTVATEEQTIKIKVKGLKDIGTATWTAHSCGASSEWSKVKGIRGENITTQTQSFNNNNEISLAMICNELPANTDLRHGKIHLEVHDRGMFNEFYLPVEQSRSNPKGSLVLSHNKDVVICLDPQKVQTVKYTVYSNVPWKVEIEQNSTLGDVSISPISGEIAETEITCTIPETKQTFWGVGNLCLKSAETGEIMDKKPIYKRGTLSYNLDDYVSEACTSHFLVFNNMMVMEFPYVTSITASEIGYPWGQKESGYNSFIEVSAENKKDWNAGSEDTPIKGPKDPCPLGWRMMTKKEFEKLIEAKAFITKDYTSYNKLMVTGPIDSYDRYNNYFSSLIRYNDSRYNTRFTKEWTSFADDTGVCRVIWQSSTNPTIRFENLTYQQLKEEYETVKSQGDRYKYYGVRCIKE